MVLWKIIILHTKFLTTIDDWIRLGTMSILSLLLANALNLSGVAFTLIIAIGVAIDVHDILGKAIDEKPLL